MQFVRFLTVGLLNTFVGMLCIHIGMCSFGLDYRFANAVGYGVGCVLSFAANRSWTFHYDGSYWSSAARWAIVVVTCFLLNLGVVIILHERLHVQSELAQLGGIVCYTAASFIGGRLFAFRNERLTVLKEMRG